LKLFHDEIVRNPSAQYALLIDGGSLAIALQHCPIEFRDTTIKCHAVLCCRLSPLQKCEVVHLMKSLKDKLVTAAIGDGANDVSMIQEAHVGLGIVGKEGRQAARCSDYAFAKFCMLKRMLFLHGHYSSQRLAILVLYFFYKNLVLVAMQFYFQMDSLFSTQSIYDSLYLALYNTLYTAFPILLLSLTEKVYNEDKLMKDPELYKKISRNRLMSWKYFFLWIVLALFHSFITYIFSFTAFSGYLSMINSGKSVGIHSFGTTLIQNAVFIVNIKLLLETTYQTYVFIATVVLSIAVFIGSTFVYGLIDR
jgi:phospholipid-translocating ATPase